MMCAACLQMYLQVRELVPNVQYNSRAQVLSLKTPGRRKQERLPGKAESYPAETGFLLGVRGSLLACMTALEGCSLPHRVEEACSAILAPDDGRAFRQPHQVTCAKTVKSSRALRAATICAGTVAVLSAGTADEGVAEECRVVADYMGCYSFRRAWLQPCMLPGMPAGLRDVLLKKGVTHC